MHGRVFQGKVVEATVQQTAARELDFDFAQDLGMRLHAEIVNDLFTSKVDARLKELGATRTRTDAQEDVARRIVHGMLGEKGRTLVTAPPDVKDRSGGRCSTANMTDEDLEFAKMCSGVLRKNLMTGIDFSRAVVDDMKLGHTQARAQKEVVMISLDNIFRDMRAGILKMPEPSNFAYVG